MAETMTAILKEEPPELSQTNPNISPVLEKIVCRCLEKKPELRFQTASDLGFALEALSAPTNTSASSLTVASDAVAETVRSAWRGWIPWIAAGGFALVAFVLGPSISGLRVTDSRR
jgi:serine/threonine protein kinase